LGRAWRRSRLDNDDYLVLVGSEINKVKLLPVLILFLSFPTGWFVIFRNEAFNHNYEYLLFAPFIAITAGLFWSSLSGMAKEKAIIILSICLSLFLIETSYATTRYFHLRGGRIETRESKLFKGFFKETDVLIVDSWSESFSTAYITGNHVKWITDRTALEEFFKSKSPSWATGYYFVYGEVGAKDKLDSQNVSYQWEIRWLKGKLGWVGIFSPDVRDRSPLAKWLMENFQPKVLPTGLIIFDLTGYKESIRNLGP
jgi:hypothetical protein